MKVFAVTAIAALAGACASNPGAQTSVSERDRVIATGVSSAGSAQASMITTTGQGPVTTTVAGPPDRVLQLVHRAYTALAIPVTVNSPSERRIGNLDFRRTGTLNGVRLSRFVSCGDGLTGPKADAYRVFFSVETKVAPTADGKSTLNTSVVASASDVAGGNPDRMPCGSTGTLEARITELVRTGLP